MKCKEAIEAQRANGDLTRVSDFSPVCGYSAFGYPAFGHQALGYPASGYLAWHELGHFAGASGLVVWRKASFGKYRQKTHVQMTENNHLVFTLHQLAVCRLYGIQVSTVNQEPGQYKA